MKILITGGAGYIGSVLSEQLHQLGHQLIIIDDLRDGKKAALMPGNLFFESNYGEELVLDQIFSENPIELVIHLAASANVPDSVIHPLNYYENNVSGTIILLKKMEKYGVKKIIFSSTAAVYGNPQFSPITELHPLIPVNPYGWSKLFDEQIIQDCAHSFGLQYFIFRYFCAAGATATHGESRPCESHLIPLAIDTAIGTRKELFVYGNNFDTQDGTGVRDYIHVSDIANAHLLAMEAPIEKWNQMINLGTSKGYSVIEIIQVTEEIIGKKINFSLVEKRPGDPSSLIASNEKANQIIQWQPSFSLEAIIESAYQWRSNPIY
jgi:UDP-glucose 4-epimerase